MGFGKKAKPITIGSSMAWFNIAIVSFSTFFALLGIMDLCFFKNRLGIGESFQKGVKTIGVLVLTMAGMISLAPMISFVNQKTLGPLFTKMGMDPSIPLTTFLPIDMGGYHAATLTTDDVPMSLATGIVYASMSGVTFLFILPTISTFLKEEDLPTFGRGLLIGLWGIPIGTLIGGCMLGIDSVKMLYNLIFPCVFFTILFVLLLLFPKGTLHGFKIISKIIEIISLLAFGITLVRDLVLIPIGKETGFDAMGLPFFRYLAPLSEGIQISGNIGLILCGLYPFLTLLHQLLDRAVNKLAKRVHGTKEGLMGPLLSATNLLMTYDVFHQMTKKEQVLNAAFAVGASYALCDHVAFAIAEAPTAVLPMMVGKLVAGFLGLGIAYLLESIREKKNTKPVPKPQQDI